MDPQYESRVRVYRFFVVRQPGLVGGPNLDQDCAALGHDGRDPERPADLNQFAPGDEDLSAGGQRIKDQKDRGSVVINDRPRFALKQAAHPLLEVPVTVASLSGLQIVFQIGVGAGDIPDCLNGLFRKGGPADIGVKDDTGRVDDFAE